MKILFFATKGFGSNEDQRIQTLVQNFQTVHFQFQASKKINSFFRLLKSIRSEKPDLVAMEGSGVAGGFALILGRILFGQRFVVSSGDAITPFLSAKWFFLKPVIYVYEKLLYALSAGFIGWTPYLVGRALTMGTPRGITAEHWNFFSRTAQEQTSARARIRKALSIPENALVIGIVGSLAWSRRFQYCYGMEQVRAIKKVKRPNVFVLVSGGGEGFAHLKKIASGDSRVLLTGPIPLNEVADYLAAMDVGVLPQSVDGVGSFRYTTKISEYRAAGLPVLTSCVPMAYDLDLGSFWRLPGDKPWGETFVNALALFIDKLSDEDLANKRSASHLQQSGFNQQDQIRRVTNFLSEL